MRQVKRARWGVVAGTLAVLGACAEPPSGAGTVASASATASGTASAAAPEALPSDEAPALVRNRSGSSIAITVAEDALLVASEDHRALFRVALPLSSTSKIDRIEMPGAPAQVVTMADKVLVTVRDPGLLLELATEGGALVEKRRLPLAADAWGLAVTPDGGTAVVTSAWTHTVTGVDLGAMTERWTAEVAREPRGVLVLPDGERAYVSHLVGSALTRIDAIASREPRVKPVELAPARSRTSAGKQPSASLGYSLVADPQGKRVFAPRHALGAVGAWFSPSWWGATTVDVLLTATDESLAPRKNGLEAVLSAKTTHPEKGLSYLTSGRDASADSLYAPVPMADWDLATQPRAAVYRERTHTLLVASEGRDLVVELDARTVEPIFHPLMKFPVYTMENKGLDMQKTGGAPQGIVLDAAERHAFVFSRSTYDVSMLALHDDPHGTTGEASMRPPMLTLTLATDPLLEGAETGAKRRVREIASWGRRFFYAASKAEISGGMACSGCHPEGRDDGFTWQHHTGQYRESLIAGTEALDAMEPFGSTKKASPGTPRQTPMLAGRVKAVGPYGWRGESDTLEARVVAGFELHFGSKDAKGHAQALADFLRFGLTPPPRITRALTAQEEQGRAVFTSDATGCVACHDPASGYTDRKPVAVRVPPRAGFADEEGAKFKTPSLLWVVGTPPYYHNGSVPTLEALVNGNDDRMGKTNHLSAADKAALVAFLRTL